MSIFFFNFFFLGGLGEHWTSEGADNFQEAAISKVVTLKNKLMSWGKGIEPIRTHDWHAGRLGSPISGQRHSSERVADFHSLEGEGDPGAWPLSETTLPFKTGILKGI